MLTHNLRVLTKKFCFKDECNIIYAKRVVAFERSLYFSLRSPLALSPSRILKLTRFL